MPDSLADGSALTAVHPDSQRTVWGEDAQQRWLELATTPACANEFGVLISSAAAVDAAMHEPNLF
ncbi:MAG: cytochrome, partial [Pseudonocardiales bacterium]|nr:cytochrome [Pseudonocardiales bacterium]